jgi:hypothetical protein
MVQYGAADLAAPDTSKEPTVAPTDILTFSRARNAAVAAVAALALFGCSSDPERDEETGELAESGDVGVFDLEVGDCLGEEISEGEVESLEAAPCSEPHSEEIFAALTIPDGDYPGQEALDAEVEGCFEEFTEFVGMPYEESVLEINYMAPTEESWGQGDRELLCTVYDPEAETTGTLQNANR